MRLPAPPPDFLTLFQSLTQMPNRLIAVTGKVAGPLVSGKYLPWDKIRFHPRPGDLTAEEWWFGIKLHRRGTPIPLVDRAADHFSYNLADPLSKYLHEIDLMTGGIIRMPEEVANAETRDSYVARSLVEEAFTSSQLEGAAKTRAIAKELVRKERSPQDRGERMILNNYRAMRRIIEIKEEPLSRELVFEIHRIVTEGALDDPSGAGRFRRGHEPCVVGDGEGTIFHEPPVAGQLEARMAQLCDFANSTAESPYIHPAIRSMILHFWLAYDHPFLDGNGRTARALFYWSMLHHDYWLFKFISISGVILKSSTAYGEAFLHSETDENDLTYFLLYHADIVRRSIEELKAYIGRRSDELRLLQAKLRGMDSLKPRQRDLMSHAIRHAEARYTVESHQASHNVSRQTSNNDLLELERKGLLRRIRDGRQHYFRPSVDLERKLGKPG